VQDLITYEVLAANPIIVKESTQNGGIFLGAMHLDRALVHVLREAVGKNAWETARRVYLASVLNTWEMGLKQDMDGKETSRYVRFPVSKPNFAVKVPL
jgi:hypothetical protein